jgi:hypothetical protein
MRLCFMGRRLLPAPLFALALVVTAVAPVARADCAPTDPATLASAVRADAFGRALAARIDACATEARTADAERFWGEHHVEPTRDRIKDYVRARTIFEMTRDGGAWRLRWAITNQEPTAKRIWAAWGSTPPATSSAAPSGTAECDEISALFAGLSRRTGVRGIGLFWPTRDHTIAAWEAAPGVRVLVPTTQIYAACDDTFDRAPFPPNRQRGLFEFPATDIPDAAEIPREAAVFLLDQVTHYGGASLDLLAAIRIHRALALRSSVAAACGRTAATIAMRLRATALPVRDHAALARYGATELGGISAAAALDRIAARP